MKQIIAYIKPLKLSATTMALHRIEGLTGLTVIECKGYGRGGARAFDEGLADYVPHVKLELFCTDDKVDRIVSTIQQAAHTGLRGDGKIYILPVDAAVRISTGECGEVAA
jgi:nitrogen regulatory protein P-II 1